MRILSWPRDPQFVVFHSVAGDVKFWDPRFTESVRSLETIGNSAAFEVHHQAKVFATWVLPLLVPYWSHIGLMLFGCWCASVFCLGFKASPGAKPEFYSHVHKIFTNQNAFLQQALLEKEVACMSFRLAPHYPDRLEQAKKEATLKWRIIEQTLVYWRFSSHGDMRNKAHNNVLFSP